MSRLIPAILTVLIASSLISCGHVPDKAQDASVEQRFDAALKSRPELIAFLRAMPKGADLHHHLNGSTFSEHILQSAHKLGLNYNLQTNMFTDEPLGSNIISTAELRSSFFELSSYRDHYSMRGWHQNTENGRDHFFSIFRRIASSGRLPGEMLVEVLKRNALQNVQYIESIAPVVPLDLRESIGEALITFDVDDLESGYSQISSTVESDHFASAITARIDEWEHYAEVALENDRSLPPGLDYPTVTFVPYVLRMGPLRDFFISAATSMAAVNADERVAALTIVGPEDLPDSNELFKSHMKIVDFLWRRMGQPRITLHAGELVPEEATLMDMSDRIRTSIDVGHARRIGHGVSIAWEHDATGLLAQMAEEQTLVEICLTSNEVILGISGDEHPFEMYRRAGVPLSLGTDDEGISRSPLTMEFVKAVERYNLDYDDVKELVRNSVEYAFLAGDSLFIDGDFSMPRPAFADIRSGDWQPSASARKLIAENMKMRKQVQLERAFVAFEQNTGSHETGLAMRYDFQSTDRTIMSRGIAVPVTYVEPVRKGDETFPLVVMAHGHGGHRHEHGSFTQVAERLARLGVASIRMDFPGCGNSTESFAHNNISNMLADILAARDYATLQPAIDSDRVGLFGWSMGGRLVLLLSDRNEEFKAIATWTPAASNGAGSMVIFLGGQSAYNKFRAEAEKEGSVLFTTQWGQEQVLGLQWFEDLENTRPLDAVRQFKGPLLVLYGDKDDVVPPAISEAVIDAATSSVEVVRYVIEDADHGLGVFSDEPELTEEAAATVASFLSTRL